MAAGVRPGPRLAPAFAATLLAAALHAQAGAAYEESQAVSISQAAIGREIGDYTLTDSHGAPLETRALRGRPLVVSLIYTSCYHVCPMLTRHLAGVVDVAREVLGEDGFAVLTVGFDTANDTPQRMRAFAAGQGIDASTWHFASADAATMDALTRDLGFVYFASPKGFDHVAQTTVIDAGGRVYRQIYGQDFDAPLLVDPLKRLVLGLQVEEVTLAGWLDGIRIFCTVYDPSSGRYRFDYSLVLELALGLLCLGAVGGFIVHAWRHGRPAA